MIQQMPNWFLMLVQIKCLQGSLMLWFQFCGCSAKGMVPQTPKFSHLGIALICELPQSVWPHSFQTILQNWRCKSPNSNVNFQRTDAPFGNRELWAKGDCEMQNIWDSSVAVDDVKPGRQHDKKIHQFSVIFIFLWIFLETDTLFLQNICSD